MPTTIDIEVEEFDARAKESNVTNIHPFLDSDTFIENGFELNDEKTIIRRSLVTQT
jgi:hypothetical protein